MLTTFEEVVYQWWEHYKDTWSVDHADRVLKHLRDNAFADLGYLPVDEITPKQIIATVRKIEARGALDVANRVKQAIRAALPSNAVWQPTTPPMILMVSSNKEKSSIEPLFPEKSYPSF